MGDRASDNWTDGYSIRRDFDSRYFLGSQAGGEWFGLIKHALVFKDGIDAAEEADRLAQRSKGTITYTVKPTRLRAGKVEAR